MTTRIAITGGSGFIGTNAVGYYVDKSIDVINIDRAEPKNKNHLKQWRKVDILDADAVKKVLADFAPTHLIHLAARTDLAETRDIDKYAINSAGVKNVIDAISSYGGLKRVIFASSMLVCKRGYVPKSNNDYMPTTLYGKSKVAAEEIIKGAGDILSEWVIVRPTSIWGPWFEMPYSAFFDMVSKGRYLHIGKRPYMKTFGYVKNTVYQMDRLLFSDNTDINHKLFYLGDYEPVNIGEWADMIALKLGRRSFRHVPFFAIKAAALIGDILGGLSFRRFPMNSFRLRNMTEYNIIDLSNINSIIDSLPYSLEDGTKETLEWMQSAR